jgi:glyoxylase-like metal-dependent hydrolase (beta-lactamase superfamily II)
MRPEVFHGTSNAYLFSSILIDAPAGAELPDTNQIIITHEHCDHFAGLANLGADIRAGIFTADVINNQSDCFSLCHALGLDFPKKKVRNILCQGDVIECDGCSLQVIETPGHAKGAICLYEPDLKILFSGDTVFGNMGMPNLALPTSEPEKLISSYEELASLDIDVIYPGHGNEIKGKNYIGSLIRMLR